MRTILPLMLALTAAAEQEFVPLHSTLMLDVPPAKTSFKLIWDPPTSDPASIAGYDVWLGGSSGTYSNSYFTPAPYTMTEISGLEWNTKYYFTVTALSKQGVMSAPSNELMLMHTNVPVPPNPEPGPEPFELIVDSEQTTNVMFYGTWSVGKTYPKFHGTSYRHDGKEQGKPKYVNFIFTIPRTGWYEVYEWHPQVGSVGSDDVPIDIVSAAGVNTMRVNQKVSAGAWWRIGQFRFNVGRSTVARIRNDGQKGYVIADAMKLTFVSE